MYALLERARGDLRAGVRRMPLIDDVHAYVPRPHGDLLGAVGMAVEPRFADEES